MIALALSAVLAALAIGAGLTFAASATRAGAAIALGVVGVSAGLAAAAAGAYNAGIALALSGAFVTALVFAVGALAGEPAKTGLRYWSGPLAGGAALAALWAASLWAPPLPQMTPSPAPALDLARSGDLFIALAALVGVAAAAAAVLGFGERGVLGARAERRP